MAGLGATARNLSRLRGRWRDAAALVGTLAGGTQTEPASGGKRLRLVPDFGDNPGDLAMFVHVPVGLPAGAPLVVVLHGCGQTAEGYDAGSGWSTLAERHGFALVYAQQSAANNQNRCFNWFLPGDTRRGSGEALSIRQMIARAVADHGSDPARIFVTGLSAGGAMAAVMLATYPEVFAGGGIVAGLPYGAAGNVQQALGAMFEPTPHDGRYWGDRVREASPNLGTWPRISIWHGSADATVKPANATALARQWTDVHGLPEAPTRRETVDGQAREVWTDAGGRPTVERFTVAGMGHGTPLKVGEGADMCGHAGPYLLDVGISSSHHMAAFWGLTESQPALAGRGVAIASPDGTVAWPSAGPARSGEASARPAPGPAPRRPDAPARPAGGLDVGSIIADALRTAGLLKR